MKSVRYLGIAALIVCGITTIASTVQLLFPQYIYRKDFIQEYLLAKAALNHMYPYLPLPELAGRLAFPLPHLTLPHPTPHPPPVALLCLPIALLPYGHAVIAWYAIQLLCITYAIYGGLLCVGRRHDLQVALPIALIIVSWSPFKQDLALGQLMTTVLALLVAAWRMLQAGKEVRCGILLGSAVAVKLVAWPMVLFFLISRRWRIAAAASAVTVIANALAALIMGWEAIRDYYGHVGALIFSLYRGHAANFSLWTIGWRIFDGTGSPALWGIKALPAVASPEVAKLVAFIPPMVVLVAGVYLALRTASRDAAFALMTCVCILVSPITWCSYLTLSFIPVLYVLDRLQKRNFPARDTNTAIVIALILLTPPSALTYAMIILANQDVTGPTEPTVPFVITLISLLPAAGVLRLMSLIWRAERRGGGGGQTLRGRKHESPLERAL